MARKSSSAISDEEFDGALTGSAARSRMLEDSPLDARMLDLEDEAESPFLRGQKRVPVRRGPLPLPRSATGRLKLAFILIAVVAVIAFTLAALQRYAAHSWRFRLESSDNISVSGANNVPRAQVLDAMASDLDRNVFFVPLELRQQQLEQIPWVKSATVMRLLPNRLKIVLTERTPVAFVDINSHIALIDSAGVIMELPRNQAAKYSFPVIVGMSDSDPLSTRTARMKIYSQFAKELDSGGANYTASISDVDLSDPDDLKATVTDAHGAVLVHLGSSDFLERFKIYVAHVQEWRAQFHPLESVDLRYDHQVIVNPDIASSLAKPAAANAATTNPPESSAAQHNEQKKSAVSKKKKKHT